MNEHHIIRIAQELNIQVLQVIATAKLLEEGATVPFIARYRKEATESLDEVAITSIRDRLGELKALDDRRTAIVKSLEERNLMTDELREKLNSAETLARLEDIFQPYRPKRRTRAMIAAEKGLSPLAGFIFENQNVAVVEEALRYVVVSEDAEKAVPSVEEALKGARDILAERFSDDTDMRAEMRTALANEGILASKVCFEKEAEGAKYRDYFDFNEAIAKIPSHRLLAIRRGANEGFLYFNIAIPDERALGLMHRRFLKIEAGKGLVAGTGAEQVSLAIADGYKRLLAPSMETDVRLESKKKAEEYAIKVFGDNVRELLLASPLGRKRVLAIDPGFRTGCKVVCLDAQGALIHDTVIYPGMGSAKDVEAGHTVMALCQRFDIEAIAIGNGTASRETEAFVRKLGLPARIVVVMVNESGASIYSASDVAREEFPDKDLTVRGSVSIGRRLMDPLAELVKLDPKSIGVGQYQHDVDQNKLKACLDDVVVSCVNKVGVEVNTASKQLLQYVSGLNSRIAENIVAHRTKEGAFKSRKALLEVSGLGPKTFEQSAGFLRIRGGKHPLDASAVHPESYGIVETMASDMGCTVPDLMQNPAMRAKIKLEKYVNDKVGLPTLEDILQELARPGRDPREQFEAFSFAEGVNTIEDLKPGMRLSGIVTNVAAFGAFVDIGVHQDGLVHISELSDDYVTDPAQVVKVQQHVKVTVMEVDSARKRIALSMKTGREGGKPIQNKVGGKSANDVGTRPVGGQNKNARPSITGQGGGRTGGHNTPAKSPRPSGNFGSSLADLF